MTPDLPIHIEATARLPVAIDVAFDFLDDHRRLSGHLEKRSLSMLGGRMHTFLDAGAGRCVGSHIRLAGHVLGIPLAVDEVVERHERPSLKIWATVGEPRLLVIGAYRMGYALTGDGAGCRLVVFIEYALPSTGWSRPLGWLLAAPYARWCVRRMVGDAVQGLANR